MAIGHMKSIIHRIIQLMYEFHREHIFQNRRFISITPQSDLLEMRLHGDRGSSLSLYPNFCGS